LKSLLDVQAQVAEQPMDVDPDVQQALDLILEENKVTLQDYKPLSLLYSNIILTRRTPLNELLVCSVLSLTASACCMCMYMRRCWSVFDMILLQPKLSSVLLKDWLLIKKSP
jgi:hypothetical protein